MSLVERQPVLPNHAVRSPILSLTGHSRDVTIGSGRRLQVLVALTKTDLTTPAAVTELRLLLRLTELRQLSAQQLTVTELSCLTDAGLTAVTDWVTGCVG